MCNCATLHPIRTALGSCYIIETSKSLLLVDSLWPHNENTILKVANEIKKPIVCIFLTHAHADHYGSAKEIKAKTDCDIVIHQDDGVDFEMGKTSIEHTDFLGMIMKIICLPIMEMITRPSGVKQNICIYDNWQTNIDDTIILAIHTPGHTKGSVCYLIDDMLFVGDLADGYGKIQIQRHFANNWTEITNSVKMLIQYKYTQIFTGHGNYVGNKNDFFVN